MVLQVSKHTEARIRAFMAKEGFANADAAVSALLDGRSSGDPNASAPATFPIDVDLEPSESINLSSDEWERFEAVMQNPPPASTALDNARQKWDKMISRSER